MKEEFLNLLHLVIGLAPCLPPLVLLYPPPPPHIMVGLSPWPGNTKRGKYHFTIDLLFDWFGISSMTTDKFQFYLQNRLIQTSQTGGQRYSDTSPFSIPCLVYKYNTALKYSQRDKHSSLFCCGIISAEEGKLYGVDTRPPKTEKTTPQALQISVLNLISCGILIPLRQHFTQIKFNKNYFKIFFLVSQFTQTGKGKEPWIFLFKLRQHFTQTNFI